MTSSHPADAPTFPVADLDRRFYAFVIDRIVVWAVFSVAATAAWRSFLSEGRPWEGLALIAGVVLPVLLVLAAVLGTTGVSPGKALLGVRVVHHGTGTPLGFPRALLRNLVLEVATLPTFGLGVATLAWTALMDPGGQRRGWHDQITQAVALDVRPVARRSTTTSRRDRGTSSTSRPCGWSPPRRRRRSPLPHTLPHPSRRPPRLPRLHRPRCRPVGESPSTPASRSPSRGWDWSAAAPRAGPVNPSGTWCR
jgi:uncharacterized RDD family membrane protein YckC